MKQFVLSPGSRRGSEVVLSGRDHHYLVHVRRVVAGDRISALEGDRRLVLETVKVERDRLTLAVLSETDTHEDRPRLTLFPFLLKQKKLDDVIRQACEAGAAEIVPVAGDHCVARFDSAEDELKKYSRWAAIAREAAQQSGANSLCEVFPPVSSRNLPEWWEGRGPLFFFHQVPLAKTGLHRYLTPQPERIGLVVGPEGGLSAAEVHLFQGFGALPVWLGTSVLRAETASLYALAAVQIILQEQKEWTILS